jgi:peptidoglycan/xylan/chitin deacetylase (PgdA/CDA1 family)
MNLRDFKIRAANLAVSFLHSFSFHKNATNLRVPVLCYHRVLPELREGETPIYTLTPEEFDSHMALLAKQWFRSLSLDEYIHYNSSGVTPPERSVLVTFDDGYADNFYHAWPIAERHGIKINLFLCTGLIEGAIQATHGDLSPGAKVNKEKYPELWRPLTWSEVRLMAEQGVGIGFHSHTHQNLGQMGVVDVIEDLRAGLSLLDDKLGAHPKAFAFPGGGAGAYNSELVPLLRNFGFEILFTTRLGRTKLCRDQILCSRLVIYQSDDLKVFQRKLFGAYDWMGRARDMDQYLRTLLSS